MTDIELLEMAARAAGLTSADYAGVEYDGSSGLMLTDEIGRQTVTWSPLTDDGDAFRLAVALCIQILLYEESEYVCAHTQCSLGVGVGGYHTYQDGEYMIEPFNGDKFSATRRAIVRAAAKIEVEK